MRPVRNGTSRAGAALIEMAAVAIVFLLFLFGIIEYSRFIFVRQVTDNATREGARYAAVRTISPTLESETLAVVNKKMAGVQNGLKNYTVSLYQADASGNYQGPATGAEFGEFIVVQIEADYSPVLPNFLLMGNTIHINTRTLINSEAN